MKEQLTKLRRLIRNGFINPEDYYNISTQGEIIYLQGRFNPDVLKKHADFEVMIEDGMVKLKRSNIKITLT